LQHGFGKVDASEDEGIAGTGMADAMVGAGVIRRMTLRPAMLVTLIALLATALVAVPPNSTANAASESEARCLALTLYWEAREEGRDGMLAVGWVVLNRLRSAKFPSTICQVVRQGGASAPCQFSFWCDGKPDQPEEGASWTLARSLADELLSASPPDPTRGALRFHRDDVRPAWSAQHRRTARVGRHIYYR
jgi:N-acetylmuramoyl-L-alanine amidase